MADPACKEASGSSSSSSSSSGSGSEGGANESVSLPAVAAAQPAPSDSDITTALLEGKSKDEVAAMLERGSFSEAFKKGAMKAAARSVVDTRGAGRYTMAPSSEWVLKGKVGGFSIIGSIEAKDKRLSRSLEEYGIDLGERLMIKYKGQDVYCVYIGALKLDSRVEFSTTTTLSTCLPVMVLEKTMIAGTFPAVFLVPDLKSLRWDGKTEKMEKSAVKPFVDALLEEPARVIGMVVEAGDYAPATGRSRRETLQQQREQNQKVEEEKKRMAIKLALAKKTKTAAAVPTPITEEQRLRAMGRLTLVHELKKEGYEWSGYASLNDCVKMKMSGEVPKAIEKKKKAVPKTVPKTIKKEKAAKAAAVKKKRTVTATKSPMQAGPKNEGGRNPVGKRKRGGKEGEEDFGDFGDGDDLERMRKRNELLRERLQLERQLQDFDRGHAGGGRGGGGGGAMRRRDGGDRRHHPPGPREYYGGGGNHQGGYFYPRGSYGRGDYGPPYADDY